MQAPAQSAAILKRTAQSCKAIWVPSVARWLTYDMSKAANKQKKKCSGLLLDFCCKILYKDDFALSQMLLNEKPTPEAAILQADTN